MSTTQLRRYRLPADPAEQDAWVAWWRDLVEPRRQFGFEVVFAYLDRQACEFLWAVRHRGDFLAAERQYVVSPERVEIMGRDRPHSEISRVCIVDVLVE